MQISHSLTVAAGLVCTICTLAIADDAPDAPVEEPRELRVAARNSRPIRKNSRRGLKPSGEPDTQQAAVEPMPAITIPRPVYKPEISAPNLEVKPKPNPYGSIQDRRGLRPYKPGVKYDRNERDSGFFGLFGSRR